MDSNLQHSKKTWEEKWPYTLDTVPNFYEQYDLDEAEAITRTE